MGGAVSISVLFPSQESGCLSVPETPQCGPGNAFFFGRKRIRTSSRFSGISVLWSQQNQTSWFKHSDTSDLWQEQSCWEAKEGTLTLKLFFPIIVLSEEVILTVVRKLGQRLNQLLRAEWWHQTWQLRCPSVGLSERPQKSLSRPLRVTARCSEGRESSWTEVQERKSKGGSDSGRGRGAAGCLRFPLRVSGFGGSSKRYGQMELECHWIFWMWINCK